MTAVFAFIAFVMIVAALLSEYWVMADLERQVGNSTQKGGSKHFGMFNGVSKQDFGLGARERDFAGKNRIIFVLQNVVYPEIKILLTFAHFEDIVTAFFSQLFVIFFAMKQNIYS